jgi:hypothetical protein
MELKLVMIFKMVTGCKIQTNPRLESECSKQQVENL